MNKLDTMNSIPEDLFMDFIGGLNSLLPDELELRDRFWSVLPGLEAESWEERDWGSEWLSGLDGPVLGLERGSVRNVVAVDASLVRVAESRLGTIVGLRAAVVARAGDVSVRVFGPILRLIRSLSPAGVSYEAREELRYFERLVQLWALKNMPNSLHLYDGPLLSSYDRSSALLSSILDLVDYHGTTVLGFSKESLLVRGDFGEASVGDGVRPPYVRDLTEAAKSFWSSVRPLGGVYAARLTPALHEFRVDAYPRQRSFEGFSSLVVSDALIRGYPETLILAHAHAAFSWMDIVAMRGALKENIGSAVSWVFNPRLTVLTPFEPRRHENTT